MRARGLTTIPAMAASVHQCPVPEIRSADRPAQTFLLLPGKEKIGGRFKIHRRSDCDFLFRIFEDFSLVVANHDLFVIMIQNVSRVDRNFASPSRRINDKLRYGVASCVSAQAFNDFDSFRHGSTKMGGTMNQVALV